MESSIYDRRRLLIIAGAVLTAVVIIVAGLSMYNDDDDGSDLNYHLVTSDYLEWSMDYITNITMTDTDNWNTSALFYLENGIQIERITVQEQNETNETLVYSSLRWERSTPEDIELAYQGIFPDLKEDYVVVAEGGSKWYAPCPDPDIWDENWTHAQLLNETVQTAFGPLICEHHRLSIDYFVPGVLNITEGYNCTEMWDWWLFDGILIKQYRSSMTEGVLDDWVMHLYLLTGTNIQSITDNSME